MFRESKQPAKGRCQSTNRQISCVAHYTIRRWIYGGCQQWARDTAADGLTPPTVRQAEMRQRPGLMEELG